MNSEDIYSRLNEIFRDLFDDESIELTPQTTASDIPDWDSLRHVNIIVACEAAFNIKFKSSEIEDMHDIRELVGLIGSKTA